MDHEFDAASAVAEYRRVMVRVEAEPTELSKAEIRRIARRLRGAWRHRQGADSLHEMAFEEPD